MAESYEKAFDMYVGVSDPQKLNSFWTAQLQGSPYLGGRPELLQQIQQGSRPLPMAFPDAPTLPVLSDIRVRRRKTTTYAKHEPT